MIQMRIHNITPHKIASTNNFPVEDAECCPWSSYSIAESHVSESGVLGADVTESIVSELSARPSLRPTDKSHPQGPTASHPILIKMASSSKPPSFLL